MLSSIILFIAFLSFIAIVVWAYRPASKDKFEEIGESILDDDKGKNN